MTNPRIQPLLVFLACVALALTGCAAPTGVSPSVPAASGATAGDQAVLRVGIAQIVDHPSLNDLRDGFKEGMAAHGYTEGDRVVYEERNAAGDQATLTSIATSFRDKDLVVAIATPTAQAMAQAIPTKPILFAGVTDPVGAELVDSLEAPAGNLTGTSDFPPVTDQLALVKEIVPDARVVGLLYSSAETNSHIHADMVRQAAPALGLEVREATVTNSSEVGQAAESLIGVDAFFVGNDNTIVSAVETVVQVAEANRIPFIVSDSDSVTRGALASYAVDYRAQGVQTGEMAATMLAEGLTPADIPVERAEELQLTVNPAAAERIGVTLPAAVAERANHTVG